MATDSSDEWADVCLVRGSVNLDEYFYVPHISQPGETLSSTSHSTHIGGKGANQALALHRAGAYVKLHATVGRDAEGDEVRRGLEGWGVDVGGVLVDAGEEGGGGGGERVGTGRAIIQVDVKGENSIILYPGTNHSQLHERLFASTSTSSTSTRYFPPAPYLLLQNEIHPESLKYALYNVQEGTTVVFNPSPMLTLHGEGPDGNGGGSVRGVRWERVSWVVVNEAEAQGVLAGLIRQPESAKRNEDEGEESVRERAEDVVRRLRAHPRLENTGVVCTLGADGVLATGPSLGVDDEDGGQRVVYVGAVELRGEVRDTTGAGDCFAGYFVAGLMERECNMGGEGKRGAMGIGREGLEEVLRVCTVAAGMCCEKRGTIGGVPWRGEVQERISEMGFL